MNQKNTGSNLIVIIIQLAIIIFGVFAMVYLFSGGEYLGKEVVKEKTKIYSVDTQKGVKGSFIIGCGNNEEGINYYVYEDDGDKGKILRNYDAEKTYIKDELNEENDSYIETEYNITYYIPSNLEKFFKVVSKNAKYKGKDCTQIKEATSNTLYIPKGYIKKQIDLNIN